MVGPAPECQGGIASVIAAYQEAGLFKDGEVLLIPSFSGGGKLYKLSVAVRALGHYASLLAGRKAAVLHIHVASDASFWRKSLFIWLASLTRRKIIFHLHSGAFSRFVENLSSWQRRYAIATIRRSTQLLCLSTQAKTWLAEVAPDTPISLWPNPVPAALFEHAANAHVRKPELLYLGALVRTKGLTELLDAFAELVQMDDSAMLILAGSGPAQAELEHQAGKLGISGKVHFPGWINTEEKIARLHQARVLVLPSHSEGQPMVLLEAMTTRTAIVSTTVGGIPDLIDTEQRGLLVAAQDTPALSAQLRRLWKDEPLRLRLSENAYDYVSERHHARQVVATLRAMYKRLAGT